MMALGLTQFLYFKEDLRLHLQIQDQQISQQMYIMVYTSLGILVGEVTNFNNTNDGFAGYPNRQHDMLYIKVDKGK